MNLIQKQANEFFELYLNERKGHKMFLDKVRSEIYEYKKNAHKIEFIERIIQLIKIKWDNHIEKCKTPKNCFEIEFYENSIFFLQEELEDLESNLSSDEFNRSEKLKINQTLELIIEDLNKLKLGQELLYDDFSDEFKELKYNTTYSLDHKNKILS